MGYGFNNTFLPLFIQPMGFGGLYSSNVTKTETEDEKRERLKKERAQKAAEEFEKKMELIKLRAENETKIQQQIKELENYKNELNNTLDKAKKGKIDAEGNIRVKENWADYKKLPFWKKGLRAASEVVQGTWKLATGFFGYEVDEKTGESNWNWKKCLKNAAIAGGCIALTAIPVVGPVISTGLLATGVVCGTIGTGKGIIKAFNAESPEELDNACQDIGAGLTIGVSSALGLRGLGKGLQASSAATGTTSAVRSTSNNAIVQLGKDMTINAYRATVHGVQNGRNTLRTASFLRTYGSNLKGMVPKLGKSKFDTEKNNITKNIDDRLSKISQELNDPNVGSLTKAMLQQEQALLNSQKAELINTVTKNGWKGLKTNSRSHDNAAQIKNNIKEMESNGKITLNGNDYNMSNENIKIMNEALKRVQDTSKQVANLAKLRSSTMKKMAFYKKYASEVEAYTGKARESRLGRIYDTIKLSKDDFTWEKTLLFPIKCAWDAMMLQFKPWGYVQNTPTSTFYKIEETFVPEYEEGFLTSGFLADALGMGDQTLKTTITQQTEDGQTVQQEVAVTKDIVTQLETQVQQAEAELAKANEELSKLYIA